MTDTIVPAGASPGEIDAIIRQAMAAGTELYHLDRELLVSLAPDLIVSQDLCRVCALPSGDVEAAVAELGCGGSVHSYDPMTLPAVLDEMVALGRAAGATEDQLVRVDALRQRLDSVRRAVAGRPRPRVLLLEWIDPPFTAGHWIPDQIAVAGGEAVLAHPGGRSSATSWETVATSGAEVLLVAPCGFGIEAAEAQLRAVLERPELAQLPAVRNGRVHAIDGDSYVVRPGPRLVDGVEAMADLLHPGARRASR